MALDSMLFWSQKKRGLKEGGGLGRAQLRVAQILSQFLTSCMLLKYFLEYVTILGHIILIKSATSDWTAGWSSTLKFLRRYIERTVSNKKNAKKKCCNTSFSKQWENDLPHIRYSDVFPFHLCQNKHLLLNPQDVSPGFLYTIQNNIILMEIHKEIKEFWLSQS